MDEFTFDTALFSPTEINVTSLGIDSTGFKPLAIDFNTTPGIFQLASNNQLPDLSKTFSTPQTPQADTTTAQSEPSAPTSGPYIWKPNKELV